MDYRHLKYFLEVASQKSFSKAARNLHISQSAISRMIKSLEDEIGVLPEFVRSALDEEETSHIDYDDDVNQALIIVDYPCAEDAEDDVGRPDDAGDLDVGDAVEEGDVGEAFGHLHRGGLAGAPAEEVPVEVEPLRAARGLDDAGTGHTRRAGEVVDKEGGRGEDEPHGGVKDYLCHRRLKGRAGASCSSVMETLWAPAAQGAT